MVTLSEKLIVRLAEKWRGRLFDLEKFAALNSIDMEEVNYLKSGSSNSVEAFAQGLVRALQPHLQALEQYLDRVLTERDQNLVEEINECLEPQGYKVSITEGSVEIVETKSASLEAGKDQEEPKLIKSPKSESLPPKVALVKDVERPQDNGRIDSKEYDAFICHASEDKKEAAEPLAKMLIAKNLKVWYDKFTLKVGDSLRKKIDYGLAHSRFGIVILSPSFFKKEWPQRELDGLAAIEDNEGRKVILPVWHHVDRDYVVKFSPTLAGRLASKTIDGLEVVLKELLEVILESAGNQSMQRVAGQQSEAQVKAPTNNAVGLDIDSDMKQMFLEHAKTLTSSHLRILEFLDNPHGYGDRHAVKFGNYMAGGVSTILEEAIPVLKGRREIYDQLVQDLYAKGLLNIDKNGLHTMMTETGMFASRTTEIGKKFLEFVHRTW